MTVDPVDRAMRVRAGVVFPGPEWREDVYNEDTRRLELVQVCVRACVCVCALEGLGSKNHNQTGLRVLFADP